MEDSVLELIPRKPTKIREITVQCGSRLKLKRIEVTAILRRLHREGKIEITGNFQKIRRI